MNHSHGLSQMPLWRLSFQQAPSRREGGRRAAIATDNLRALIRARHFLAGLLIGAVIVLPAFLLMG